MRKVYSLIILQVLLALFTFSTAEGQLAIKRDSSIIKMINKISADSLKSYVVKLTEFKTRHSLSSRTDEKEGIGAAARWVKSKFEQFSINSDGRLISELDFFEVKPDGIRIDRKVNLMNVIGTLKGYDVNDRRLIIVGAHLDSRVADIMDSTSYAPGANDDLSGVAAVLELARVMSSTKFPATIMFVAFTGEEQGLYGSNHLAEKIKSLQAEGKYRLIAMLNNDMIGNTLSSQTKLKDNINVRVFSESIPAVESDEEKRIRILSGSDYDGISRQLARYIKEVGERYVDQINVKLIFRRDRFLRGGDHTPFNRHGFAAVRFCEMNENYFHQHEYVREENGIQYGDLPEFIDFEYARKITAVNCAVIANLALAPPQPENVRVDVKKLSNTTILTWDNPTGKKPSGYYVLMRETYMPLWEKKIYVESNSIELPYSKDNYLFAVQSVDEEGHESLPVFPVPDF
ncbi:M20/M25/M40 family metallo-hydrolase [Melioribacter sp. OK-6-Me]|uniref:M20/M25/M40 family metallo-hydrolase n=1 Tax=unclassified Melioribacter TaxID=2627329 RepID=UPI003ED8AFF7